MGSTCSLQLPGSHVALGPASEQNENKRQTASFFSEPGSRVGKMCLGPTATKLPSLFLPSLCQEPCHPQQPCPTSPGGEAGNKSCFWGALSWAWLSQVPQQQNLGRLRFPSGGRAAGAGNPGHLSSIRHGNELNLGDSLEPGDGDLLGFGSKAWH